MSRVLAFERMTPRRATRQPIDPRHAPAYSVAEAAYIIGVPSTTLHKWFYGREYHAEGQRRTSPRVIVPADAERGLLSFTNVAEAHVLDAIRKNHFSLKAIRDAVQMLSEFGPHPLISWEFVKRGKELLVRYLTEGTEAQAISVSRPTMGQALLADLELYLDRIVRDDEKNPVQLFPMRNNPERRIVSDLYIAGGEPVIAGTGILVQFVFERNKTGESAQEIAADYGIDERAVEDAIRFVSAA